MVDRWLFRRDELLPAWTADSFYTGCQGHGRRAVSHFLLFLGLIHFLGGKPRGGKSLRALMMIVKELREGRRPIVTNLAVKLDELQEYCDRHGIETSVLQRITILDKDQTKRFWRFRGYGLELHPNLDGTNRHKKTGEILPNEQQPLDLAPIYGVGWEHEETADPSAGDEFRKLGVCYIIDEAHMHFGARYWERTEDEALWYGSQHSKLCDTVWFVTQSISNVVKQLRDLAQDYIYCRNLRKEKRGLFRAGNNFVAHTHLRVQQPGSTEDDPIEKDRYELDPELIECYDTSAGVGVPGGGKADKGEKVKGLSVKWIWAGAVAAFAALWVIGGYFPRFLRYGLVHVSGIEANHSVTGSKLAAQMAVRPSMQAMQEVHTPPMGEARPVAQVQTELGQKDLWVTGVVGRRVGGNVLVNVMLSDGRTLTESDGTLARLDRTSVVLVDGRRLWMKRILPGSIAPPQPAAKAAEGSAAEKDAIPLDRTPVEALLPVPPALPAKSPLRPSLRHAG